jgi:hypothetical protein
MTLYEAIEKYEGNASLQESIGLQAQGSLHVHCFKCAAEYRQLTGWLKELKDYREKEHGRNMEI